MAMTRRELIALLVAALAAPKPKPPPPPQPGPGSNTINLVASPIYMRDREGNFHILEVAKKKSAALRGPRS